MCKLFEFLGFYLESLPATEHTTFEQIRDGRAWDLENSLISYMYY